MKDMQDDASKEGNDVDAAIICLPTPKQTKFTPSKTNGRRPRQCLQRGRYVPENAPVVGPKRADQAFADLRSQPHAALRQSKEAVNRWEGSKQLLVVTMESFCRKVAKSNHHYQEGEGARPHPHSPRPTHPATLEDDERRGPKQPR
jgi:hypothetical protein